MVWMVSCEVCFVGFVEGLFFGSFVDLVLFFFGVVLKFFFKAFGFVLVVLEFFLLFSREYVGGF